jgi:hypothetical protein
MRVVTITIMMIAGIWPYYLFVRVSHMPQKPVAEIGRIYPYNDHGTTVYMTKLESFLDTAFFVSFFGGFLLLFLSRKIERKNFIGRWED